MFLPSLRDPTISNSEVKPAIQHVHLIHFATSHNPNFTVQQNQASKFGSGECSFQVIWGNTAFQPLVGSKYDVHHLRVLNTYFLIMQDSCGFDRKFLPYGTLSKNNQIVQNVWSKITLKIDLGSTNRVYSKGTMMMSRNYLKRIH